MCEKNSNCTKALYITFIIFRINEIQYFNTICANMLLGQDFIMTRHIYNLVKFRYVYYICNITKED